MTIWFTRPGAAVDEGFVKRFAAHDWTVDFPRGAMASSVTTADGRGMTVEAHFLRKGDLVGLIYERTSMRTLRERGGRAGITRMPSSASGGNRAG